MRGGGGRGKPSSLMPVPLGGGDEARRVFLPSCEAQADRGRVHRHKFTLQARRQRMGGLCMCGNKKRPCTRANVRVCTSRHERSNSLSGISEQALKSQRWSLEKLTPYVLQPCAGFQFLHEPRRSFLQEEQRFIHPSNVRELVCSSLPLKAPRRVL